MKPVVLLSVPLTIAACTYGNPVNNLMTMYQQIDQESDQAYNQGLTAIDSYKSLPQCNGQDAQTIGNDLRATEKTMVNLRALTDPASGPAGTLGLPYAAAAKKRHIDLTLQYAAQAIKNGCFDEADQVCRRLLDVYSDTGDASIRDRAKVCIDDIRAARQSNRNG
jgi:hypothetical protein